MSKFCVNDKNLVFSRSNKDVFDRIDGEISGKNDQTGMAMILQRKRFKVNSTKCID